MQLQRPHRQQRAKVTELERLCGPEKGIPELAWTAPVGPRAGPHEQQGLDEPRETNRVGPRRGQKLQLDHGRAAENDVGSAAGLHADGQAAVVFL